MSPRPKFPLYVPSKGRFEYLMTPKALTAMGVEHSVVVEPQEAKQYRQAVKSLGLKTTVLVLDMSYKEKYDYCDNYGLSKSSGSGPARNFIWDHSVAKGCTYHWIMDDNIRDFRRLQNNKKHKVLSSGFWCAMEDFALQYDNVAMSGPEYAFFINQRRKWQPFRVNTRIYSCNLIRNDVPLRWRGRYNEDTILSLDMLKAGWCTILFLVFLQGKVATQTMKGGNTDQIYDGGPKFEGQKYSPTGTIDKSKMLHSCHPDVTKLVTRFGRAHHVVDYAKFRKRPLIKAQNYKEPSAPNNYGMRLAANSGL